MSQLMMKLDNNALSLAEALQHSGERIVFAESCTGGLVSATLATIPGISNHLCGSAVTYRGATKVAWLGVDATAVERDSAVNEDVARQMAQRVLTNTPESDVAVSVTGHLGPDAPQHLDGTIFIGLAARTKNTQVNRHSLTSNTRRDRQIEAANLVLISATEWIRRS